MTEPDEYSPEFQDEYRRLWHESAAERDRFKTALATIANYSSYGGSGTVSAYVDVKRIAREALDG